MAKNNYDSDLAIIGGGPAGLMAAFAAGQAGKKVVIIEKNKQLGRKLLITGKGRCNITNAEPDLKKFIASYGPNGKFLYRALNNFSNQDLIAFFDKEGLKTKVERGDRVFPADDLSYSVLKVFLKLFKKLPIEILTDTAVKKIVFKDYRVLKIVTDEKDITAKNYLLATGGLAYPATGSTGEGLSWAKLCGHNLIKPQPALVPLICAERFIKDLEGLSLKNVTVTIYANNKKQAERFGEALFTKDGLSGPIILDLSQTVGQFLKSSPIDLKIDFKPALSFLELDQRLQKDFSLNKNKLVKNSLDELLPKKLIPVMLKLWGVTLGNKANAVTKDQRNKLAHLLKEFPLTVTSTEGFDKAIVTAGGVDLKDIDPNTMRSKIIPNLYLAGEILDLNGPTGGYNLQAAFSTGYLAGLSAAK